MRSLTRCETALAAKSVLQLYRCQVEQLLPSWPGSSWPSRLGQPGASLSGDEGDVASAAGNAGVDHKAPLSQERWSRWQDVRAAVVSSRIVDQVRAALFRGELKPGDVLGSETDLARKFGVSRVPVRDAFKTLQALGIVEVKMGANGGARIAAGDPSRFADALAVQLKLVGISVEEMFDAQIAIEVMATELAAKRAGEADLARLPRDPGRVAIDVGRIADPGGGAAVYRNSYGLSRSAGRCRP